MSSAITLLGNCLVNGDKSKIETGVLFTNGNSEMTKILGLYFSAQWCPPCRMFTPDLVNFFNSFKTREGDYNLQIVFVSSDEDEEAFFTYLNEMPWPALPFSDKERKNELTKQFKVQSIPVLVLVDAETGNVITTCGRDCVTDDPEGSEFPWPEKSFSSIMSGNLLKGRETVSYEEAVKGKIKGIYFSARWCPPCNGFNEDLKKVYRKLQSEQKNFEIIYISSDRTEEYFHEYYVEMEMPWLAVPFGDARIAQVTRHFDVEGIPTLIILDENDEILNTKCRAAISADPEAEKFPWPAPPAEELSEDNTALLNESPCLILFTDEESVNEASEMLLRIAGEYRLQRKSDSSIPNLCFFYEGSNSKEVAESVRAFANIDLFGSQLALLNVPEEQLYVHEEGKLIRESTIRSIVEDFKNRKLSFKKFSINSGL